MLQSAVATSCMLTTNDIAYQIQQNSYSHHAWLYLLFVYVIACFSVVLGINSMSGTGLRGEIAEAKPSAISPLQPVPQVLFIPNSTEQHDIAC